MAPSRAPDVYDRSRCLMTPLVIALVSLIFSSAASESDASFPVPKYLDYNETTTFLHNLAIKHRSLASVYSIGKSVQGRELWVLKITTDPNVRSIGKPLFRYTANIHGNEALGRQLLLYLAEYMLENYGNDSRITRLVNNTELHFCPSLNPDGYANASEGDCEGASRDSGRFNSHIVDLNGNFPGMETDLTKMTVGREPETLAIMKWSVLNPFVLSASLHGGLVVVVYPYDYRSPDAPMDSPNLTPDDDVFRHLAGTYARKHSDMFRSPQCQEYFDGGITNGAEWIPVSGSMQDFSYIYTNCYEVTLEISCCKYPMANTLVSEWEKNKNALLSYMEQVHMGVKGVVKEFRTGKAIAKATVVVQGINHNITTTERGEFWRLLLPGQYSLIVSSPGYESTVRRNITVMTGAATWVDVVLTPVPTTKPPKQYAPLDTDFVFTTKPEFKHHSQEELVAIFTNVTEKCPAITRLFSIGKSVEDRDLYFLEFSDNPGRHEPGEPEFKYVANIHGNEVIGREAVLLLAQLLCEQYGKSRRLTTLVNNTRIFLMASMNPDGYERANVGDYNSVVGRFNAHNVDLNRNFPDQYQPEKAHHPREPETRAMMNFIVARPIVLSASLHGGALVANYPYDGNKEKVERIYSATPDDSLFRYLARTYARAHPTMSLGKPCPKGPMDDAFKDGITNGAAWYNVYGGMQDFNYLHSNSYELTIEMGCYKYPPASDLPKYWDEHKHALVTFMEKVHQGVKGFVKDEDGLPVPNATIHVLGIHHDVHSAVDGDFWRLLMPATYSVRAYVDGFPLPVQRVTVLEGNATWANFTVDRRYAKWSREHDFLIGENGEPKYLGADELANLLMQLRQNYSDIVEVKDSFGPPGETALQFLRITVPSKKMKPEVVLIGGLNGGRPAGREMLIRLARHLVTGYRLRSQRIVDLLEKVVVHIVPSVDKAGFSHTEEGICDSDPSEELNMEDHFSSEFTGQYPIVEAVKEGLGVSHYVAGLVLDTGGIGVRIALNETNSGLLDNMTMDGLVAGFQKRIDQSKCGKELRPVQDGSLLQYAYNKHGTLMASVLLDCCDFPTRKEIPKLWMRTLHPILEFLEAAKTSVHGSVTDEYGTTLTKATVGVHTSKRPIETTSGAFCLAVPPGKVVLTASASEFEMRVERVTVLAGEGTSLVLVLEPDTYEHKYHSYTEALQLLRYIAHKYPNTTYLYSLGSSAGGRDLPALVLGATPRVHRPGVPEIRLQAGLAGGLQLAATEMLLHLAHSLATRYKHNSLVTQIMASARIHIAPMLDPDGITNSSIGKCDANESGPSGSNLFFMFDGSSSRPEVRAVQQWTDRYHFVTSLNVLTGGLAMALPKGAGAIDMAVLRRLAKTYAYHNDDMLNGAFACGKKSYNTSNGILPESADLGHLNGSVMDFSYRNSGTYETAAFISCCPAPNISEFSALWVQNKQSILNYLLQATQGLVGYVRTKSRDPIPGANISIEGQPLHRPSTKLGEFWVPLGEGSYQVVISAPDFYTMTKIVEVYAGRSTTVEFLLQENIVIAGLPKHVFVVLTGSLVLLLMVSALCLYTVVMSQRQPERAGFMPVQSNGGTLFDDDDDDDDGIGQRKSRKSANNSGSGGSVHSKLLKAAEYHDDTSSEDEIYNTRNWKSSAKSI
uniref:Zinc carboxypeptidase n=1 Tax=Rhipicephalus appendiculatus TaxID=34631 RepID=A0A131YMU6_RHIAP